MPENMDIVYCGVNSWDAIIQRPQHIAKGLARNHRVLYIDPTQYSFITKLFRQPRKKDSLRNWRPKFRTITDSLFVFTPPPMLPFSMWHPIVNYINCRLLYLFLKKIFSEISFNPTILWLTFPPSLPLISLLKAPLICFDCIDYYSEFFPGYRGKILVKQEAALLNKVDLVFATAPSLAEKCKKHCSSVYLLPNAASSNFIEERRRSCPIELADLPRPIIGYIGAISHWIDLELIEFLAQKRPDWSFVMIGPQENSLLKENLSNLHFLKAKEHEELPAYIDHFDVCMIPFVVNELTHHVNPVKLYEYFARGKPVVVTNTRELKRFCHLCSLSYDQEHFLKNIEAALQEKGHERTRKIQARIEIAQANKWDHRIKTISTIFESKLIQ